MKRQAKYPAFLCGLVALAGCGAERALEIELSGSGPLRGCRGLGDATICFATVGVSVEPKLQSQPGRWTVSPGSRADTLPYNARYVWSEHFGEMLPSQFGQAVVETFSWPGAPEGLTSRRVYQLSWGDGEDVLRLEADVGAVGP